ncbi:hypothetical protein D5S17_11010 [Pseudonocardiaceae bacterium YIM PH 21723]|nr:hypothetical protein D5S17_11010 [Pseudonocardiaceae bacterium YIM PH 21723]
MDDLILHKVQMYFDALDNDNDKTLTEADFHTIAVRYAEALGHAPNSGPAREISRATIAYWTDLVRPMDTDGDQRVTFEEFRSAIEQMLSHTTTRESVLQPALDAWFELADADRSGTLTKSEWVALFGHAVGAPVRHCGQVFDTIDTDGDGLVQRAEFNRAVTDFLCSSDPSNPANQLFGPIAISGADLPAQQIPIGMRSQTRA